MLKEVKSSYISMREMCNTIIKRKQAQSVKEFGILQNAQFSVIISIRF